MERYESPRITELGSVQELTLETTVYKNSGSGDVIHIAGTDINIPVPPGPGGGTFISAS